MTPSSRGRGVEPQANGRVIGLVKVWHWCGNDPVRKHIARVDIANVLRYHGHGSLPSSLQELQDQNGDRPFPPHGWSISDYQSFRMFEALLEREQPADTQAR